MRLNNLFARGGLYDEGKKFYLAEERSDEAQKICS